MARKIVGITEYDATLQTNSKLIVSGSLGDNNNSFGTSGQVLSKDALGNVVWATPTGGGGTIDGAGSANKLTYWVDGDTIDDTTLTWDSTNSRLGVNANNPAYPVDIQATTSMGGGTLHYDHTNKRIGINTASPTEKLDVNGNLRLRSGLKDGSNGIGTYGQVLISTGTQTAWQNASNLTFVENKAYFTSWKVATTGTVFLNPTAGGDGSLNYTTLMVIPFDGLLRQLTVITDGTQTGFNFALVNYVGTALWTSGTTSLTQNVATTFYPNATITKSTHRMIGIRMTRGTSSSGNYNINITATYEWN